MMRPLDDLQALTLGFMRRWHDFLRAVEPIRKKKYEIAMRSAGPLLIKDGQWEVQLPPDAIECIAKLNELENAMAKEYGFAAPPAETS